MKISLTYLQGPVRTRFLYPLQQAVYPHIALHDRYSGWMDLLEVLSTYQNSNVTDFSGVYRNILVLSRTVDKCQPLCNALQRARATIHTTQCILYNIQYTSYTL